ncbi:MULTISPECIES: BLUF domain-containing protein [unclassified Psychrobacter]|uniref:BLUF domain-containing protein n=1 Tax=unclassified Psychrobacter TaxID=196806 RepID=UPI0025B4BA55|nr:MULTISPECIES: BLUF domain-containing protein [unclassified Psychrobacter]MDN3454287.1 BLUF domain-containing protein [Psychrobacter sp. APC 3350]MDN3502009.1 BLUF domain-containing protein [Psychrobacter sp. 5A.1]
MPTINDSTNPVTTNLCQLVYISRITSTGLSSPSTLNDISEISVERNQIDNVTGILCYGNGYFLQCVEGSEQALTNLKNRLLVDDRHKELNILDFSEIAERRFASWSLRSVTLERWMTKDPELKKLMPFKPYEWDSNEWQKFLDVLQGYYEEQTRTGNIDTPPVKYSTLGVTLSKVVGQHQAFFLIQTVLGLMIVATLLWLLL